MNHSAAAEEGSRSHQLTVCIPNLVKITVIFLLHLLPKGNLRNGCKCCSHPQQAPFTQAKNLTSHTSVLTHLIHLRKKDIYKIP